MARILCIESATEVCSVALAVDGFVKDFRETDDAFSHSKKLTVYIEELLVSNGLTTSDLSAVAVSQGPGSYTGLRIGVSVAKGICFAMKIPLISVSSLKSIASFFINENTDEISGLICPMIDARRMEVYCSVYDSELNEKSGIEARIVDENSFLDLLNSNIISFIGNGAEKTRQIITHTNARFPQGYISSAKGMANLAQYKYDNGEFEDVAYFEPFYLKDFIAIKPRKNILLQNNRKKSNE